MTVLPPFLQNIRTYFREYASSSSIHGFRYLGEKRSYFEKVWWLFVFLISLATCAYTISLVYTKWQNSPLIVTFGTIPYSVYEIPFPAVTVCSMAKVNKYYYDKLSSEKFKKLWIDGEITTKYQRILSYVSSICPDIRYRFNTTEFENLDEETFLDIMRFVSPRFKIENCIFMKHLYDCQKLFTPLVTDAGLCYTFNILDAKEFYNDDVLLFKNFQRINYSSTEWTMEDGYLNNATISSYPVRTLNAGAEFSLKFQLNISSEESFQNRLCGEMSSGFIVLLHIPIRMPRLTHNFIRIPLNSSVVAAVNPFTIKTSESIMSYKPKIRHCYFSQERPLRFFKYYSQNNCELECLANSTLKECDCVDFYMPRIKNTTICNGRHHKCKTVTERMILMIKMLKLKGCDCLPLCTDITYVPSTSQAGWAPINKPGAIFSDFDYYINSDDNFQLQYIKILLGRPRRPNTTTPTTPVMNTTLPTKKPKYFGFKDKPVSRDLASVKVYFSSSDYLGAQRNELYGPTDFIANFGGLLSLFTGFSILSLMEIIYFFTLRWCCNKRIYGHFYALEERTIKSPNNLA